MIMKKTRSSMKASVKLAGDHGDPSFLSFEKKGRGVVPSRGGEKWDHWD